MPRKNPRPAVKKARAKMKARISKSVVYRKPRPVPTEPPLAAAALAMVAAGLISRGPLPPPPKEGETP